MSNYFLYYPENHAAHFSPGHPERPERVEAVRNSLIEIGWWDLFSAFPLIQIPSTILNSVHHENYLNYLQKASMKGVWLDQDTYTTPASWSLALQSVNGSISVADAVWEKNGKGFVIARPPGHHASRNRGMGFCLLNNIAVASEYLIQTKKVARLAIVDFDLHHGNGTQDIFWERDDVFFISIHQSNIFPLSGSLDETGDGKGRGMTANFPLPAGSGDQAYQEILDTMIIPLLQRYQPEIILVSYGFDPHWLDPFGSLNLSASVYQKIVMDLVDFANKFCEGKIMLVLEGGYDLDAARICTQAVISSLLDKKWTDPMGFSPYSETFSWTSVLKKAKQIWDL